MKISTDALPKKKRPKKIMFVNGGGTSTYKDDYWNGCGWVSVKDNIHIQMKMENWKIYDDNQRTHDEQKKRFVNWRSFSVSIHLHTHTHTLIPLCNYNFPAHWKKYEKKDGNFIFFITTNTLLL